MKKFFLSTLLVFIVSVAAYAQDKCSLCGMKVDEAKRQYFLITTKDGNKQKACTEGCALLFMENIKKDVKGMEVPDYNTGTLIDAHKAYYVKGSSVKPVMGGASVVAFSKKEEAEKFQKENGGKVLSAHELFKDGHSH